jgi:hypothetical protein
MGQSINVFLAYAHEDEKLLEQLQRHLSPLIRPGLIDIWYDRVINAGEEWHQEIKTRLDAAHLILLLVSPHFVHSEYCYSIEMKRAIERHERGEAHVVPIILRPVYWQDTPFGKLQALPKDAKPTTSWRDRDKAFFDVASKLKQTIEKLILSDPVVSLSKDGRYNQPWVGMQPGCLIFLLDQSASMADPFGFVQPDTGKRKCDMAAAVINNFLNELITINTLPKADGSSEVKPRADIAIMGYSNGIVHSLLDGALAGRMFVNLPELQRRPLSIETRMNREIDALGRTIEIPITFPIWVKPEARGDAPMCAALRNAQLLATQWVATHRDSYPPLVINITDGKGDDGDPTELVHQLCQISTTDGQVLLYNVHITDLNYPPMDYPVNEDELPNDPYVKQLFSMSSIIPEPNRVNIEWMFEHPFPRKARGFILNGYATSIRCMFNFASMPSHQPLNSDR